MPTVLQPNSVAALMIRVAISPRFAAITFVNGAFLLEDRFLGQETLMGLVLDKSAPRIIADCLSPLNL